MMACRHVSVFPHRAHQSLLARSIFKQQQTRGWSLLPDSQERRLNRLMQEANLHSHDPNIQAAYLRALRRVRPSEVIRRVELGKYATGEPVAKEYVRALVETGAIDRTQVSQILRTVGIATLNNYDNIINNNNINNTNQSTVTATKAATAAAAAATTTSSSSSSSSGRFNNIWGFNFRGAAAANKVQQQLQSNNNNNSNLQTEPIQVALAEPSTQSQLWRLIRVLGSTFLILGFLGVIMEERGMMKGMGINTEMKPEPEIDSSITFEDVKGCDEAKEELIEIVKYLKHPDKFNKLGGKLTKGILLVGPPGTGKTLLAKAIAGEAKRPFFYASGSEFEEMFVGVGARRIRELFANAKKHSPCIIFIDEIDAIGSKRNPKDQRFLTMTLNQLLVELDGFNSSKSNIIVIAATNFPESLDKALVRPGRFDRHIMVPIPDINGRKEILKLHSENIPLNNDVDLEIIARGTPGFTGADLANLINIACIKATVDDFINVNMIHFEYAKDKIIMGDERKSFYLSNETKIMTSYHEGGHALCCLHTKDALPIHKATIMPRGQALGLVAQLPDKDLTTMTKSQMKAKLIVCMGGRAAEEYIYGNEKVTSGAASDFKQATDIAEAMVTQYGMCEDAMGRVVYEKEKESSETRSKIEKEVRKLLDEAYDEALCIIKTNEKELHRLSSALLKHETLTGEEVRLAVKGELTGSVENDKISNKAKSKTQPEDEEEKAAARGKSKTERVLDASDTAPVR